MSGRHQAFGTRRAGPPKGGAGTRAGTVAVTAALAMTAMAALGGCASSDSFSLPKFSDMNPFAKKEAPLPGTRVPIMEATGSLAGNLAPADRPIALPPPQANDAWAQPGGTPSNAPGHLALGAAIKPAWSADAGTGSNNKGKVTASPVVYDGRVFTLDAAAGVTAFAVSGGSALWRVSLVPDGENKAGSVWSLSFGGPSGGYGGGLAADNGRLYVATGYGNLTALDPTSGKVLWNKSLGAPLRASPTAVGDRVFAITREGKVFAIAGTDGSELWTANGLPEQAGLIQSPSPAVEGDVVVAPFSSGELLGLRIGNGETLWNESLTRSKGGSAMAVMSDAARPAIDRGVVFALGHGGRMIANQARNGERMWSINLAGTQPPWVVGDYVYVVDTAGNLHALGRRDGQTLWTVKLPDSNLWSGPTLAGGQLWLVSSRGALIGVEATTGKIASQHNVGAAAFVAPVVAGGRLYVLTDNARLVAYQ